MGVVVVLYSRLREYEDGAPRFDHESGRHTLPCFHVEQLLRGTDDDDIHSQFARRGRDRGSRIGAFEDSCVTRDAGGFERLPDGIGETVTPLSEVVGRKVFPGFRCRILAQRMPAIGVDALEKLAWNFNDRGHGHASCTADQVSCEVDNGGRAQGPSGGNEYMHTVSIEERTAQRRDRSTDASISQIRVQSTEQRRRSDQSDTGSLDPLNSGNPSVRHASYASALSTSRSRSVAILSLNARKSQ